MPVEGTQIEIVKNIKGLLEKFVTEVAKNPVSIETISELRRVLKSSDQKLVFIESKAQKKEKIKPLEMNERWRSLHFRGGLDYHNGLKSNLDANERKLLVIIVRNQRLSNSTFFDILTVINKIIVEEDVDMLPKVGPLITKSFPTLVQKLLEYSNSELETRKKRT
jgi:hypothetical protein